jgi:hypothetical protein
MGTLTKAEYEVKVRNGYAGPLSELTLAETRALFAKLGATHWALLNEDGATVLSPVKVA